MFTRSNLHFLVWRTPLMCIVLKGYLDREQRYVLRQDIYAQRKEGEKSPRMDSAEDSRAAYESRNT